METQLENLQTTDDYAQGAVVLYFTAPWCHPCRAFRPTVNRLATEFAGRAKTLLVDVDARSEVAAQFNVRSVPALLFLQDGKPRDFSVGASAEAHIRSLYERHYPNHG